MIAQSRTQPRPEAALGPTRRPHRHSTVSTVSQEIVVSHANRGIPRQSWYPTPIVGSHANRGIPRKKWGGTVKPAGGGGGSYGRAARATPQPHRCSHTHAAGDPRPTRSPRRSHSPLGVPVRWIMPRLSRMVIEAPQTKPLWAVRGRLRAASRSSISRGYELSGAGFELTSPTVQLPQSSPHHELLAAATNNSAAPKQVNSQSRLTRTSEVADRQCVRAL